MQNVVVHKGYRYCTCDRVVGDSPLGVGLGAWGAKFGGSGATLPHVELPPENFAPFWGYWEPKSFSYKLAHYELTQKISSQSVHNFLCYQAHKHTNKQNDCIIFSNFIEDDDKYIPIKGPLIPPLWIG